MSYNPKLLFGKILQFLDENPSRTLGDIARSLGVSRGTIEKAIKLATGGTFGLLRQEILLAQIRTLFASEPTLSIKELGFTLGFKSPTSFARSVKRASGFSPEELRIRVASEPLEAQAQEELSLSLNLSRIGCTGKAAVVSSQK